LIPPKPPHLNVPEIATLRWMLAALQSQYKVVMWYVEQWKQFGRDTYKDSVNEIFMQSNENENEIRMLKDRIKQQDDKITILLKDVRQMKAKLYGKPRRPK